MTTPNQRGFSLLGVLVALFVLVVGGIATAQLIARTTNTLHISRNEFIAVNLAREGLELVRATRDSNWFKDTDEIEWTEHPYQDVDPTLVGLCDEVNNANILTIDRDPNIGTTLALADPAPPSNSLPPQQLYLINGQYTHAPASNQESPFWRTLTIDCANREAVPPSITVTSRVTWPEDGQIKEVSLVTQLYDWYIF